MPSDTPTTPPGPGERRSLPGIPDRHRRHESDVDRSKRLAHEAFERRRHTHPPGALAPQPDALPPSVSPDVDRALGRVVRAIAVKLWPAMLAAALGTGGAIAARPAAPPARVDAHGVRLAEIEAAIEVERTDRIAESERQRALNEAVACRLRVLASAAKRQSYDTGFAEDVLWLSEYIEPKVKGPPMWRTTERCPALPTSY